MDREELESVARACCPVDLVYELQDTIDESTDDELRELITVWAPRYEKLYEFLDWCVHEGKRLEGKAIVTAWCRCNWPEATSEDMDWLFDEANDRRHEDKLV